MYRRAFENGHAHIRQLHLLEFSTYGLNGWIERYRNFAEGNNQNGGKMAFRRQIAGRFSGTGLRFVSRLAGGADLRSSLVSSAAGSLLQSLWPLS